MLILIYYGELFIVILFIILTINIYISLNRNVHWICYSTHIKEVYEYNRYPLSALPCFTSSYVYLTRIFLVDATKKPQELQR